MVIKICHSLSKNCRRALRPHTFIANLGIQTMHWEAYMDHKVCSGSLVYGRFFVTVFEENIWEDHRRQPSKGAGAVTMVATTRDIIRAAAPSSTLLITAQATSTAWYKALRPSDVQDLGTPLTIGMAPNFRYPMLFTR